MLCSRCCWGILQATRCVPQDAASEHGVCVVCAGHAPASEPLLCIKTKLCLVYRTSLFNKIFFFIFFQDMLQLQNKAEELTIRRELNKTTVEVNKRLAEERRLRELEEKVGAPYVRLCVYVHSCSLHVCDRVCDLHCISAWKG